MNLHHLRIFHAVVSAGGITAGAARLSLSQPAASREMREFEERLGLALLDRTPRGVVPTEAGRLLHGYAERIFALERAAERDLRDLAGLAGGRLVIGASNTIGNHLLPPVLAHFHAVWPAVELVLHVTNSAAVAADLLAEAASLGFVEGPVDESVFALRPVGRDSIVAVAPPGHALSGRGPVSAATLADGVCFAREIGSGTRAVVDNAFAALGLVFRPALTMGSGEALKTLVASGGVGWLPRLAVARDLASGDLVEIVVADLSIERPLSAIWPRGRQPGPAAAALLDLLARRP
jgi:DNA-binding transcriptional LysR family regulator